MQVRCWGSRGSIPVSGREYLKYGGDTTCLEIRARSGDLIIVDAGTGIRRLGNHLADIGQKRINFLFTHAHWDHIMGFPFFKPLYFKESLIHIQRCPYHDKFVETILSKVMAHPHFPVRYADVTAQMTFEQTCAQRFEIGSIAVSHAPISHPNGGSGYQFTEDGRRFVFLTDNELGYRHEGGLSFREYVRFCDGADLLIHDAEYTPCEYHTFREWGHSVYTDTLRLAAEARVPRLGLFHLNRDRTDRQMDEILFESRRIIVENNWQMDVLGVTGDTHIAL
jgi:phosphoribosyl 1,2-cyclic phosphodiesterase